MKLSAVSCIAALVWTTSVGVLKAQAPSEPAEPEWSAPEIVVTASSPPMWKLQKGGSTVWVLGVIDRLPAGMTWNTAPLRRVLQNAKKVILPPKTFVGVFQAISALSKAHLPRGVTLNGTMGPQTRAAYDAVVRRLGKDPAKYQNEKPAWAALMLEVDLDHAPGFSATEPVATIRKLAQQAHVPVEEVDYKSGAMLDQLVALPEAEGEAALKDAVAGANFAWAHQTTAGAAWASGHLQTLRTNLIPTASSSGLLIRTPAYQSNEAKASNETDLVINRALDSGVPTLVVLTLTSLVRQGGALDRLRAEGVAIAEPSG